MFRQDPPTGPHSVTLRWTPCTNVAIAEYRILRGATAGGPYTQIASMPTGSRYTDRTVENGKTYYYVITAVDDKGAEVTRAKEFKGVIPH
jgi:fibronectin type 3 domain-containing protein